MNNKTKVKVIKNIIKIQRKIIAKNVLLNPTDTSTNINDYSYGIKGICDLINCGDTITNDDYRIKFITNDINYHKKYLQKPQISKLYEFNIGMTDIMELIESILNIRVISNMNEENKFSYITNIIRIQKQIIDKLIVMENDIIITNEYYYGVKCECDLINGLLNAFNGIYLNSNLSNDDDSWEIGVIRDYIEKRKNRIEIFIDNEFIKAQMDIILLIELILNDE